MEHSTKLRKEKRTLWRELDYRSNWVIFGTIAAVLFGMIPVIGWFIALCIVLVMLRKIFGTRETLVSGNCPACTKSLKIDIKQDVIACPVCSSCINVLDDRLTLVDLPHRSLHEELTVSRSQRKKSKRPINIPGSPRT